jgi:hypothetical protein
MTIGAHLESFVGKRVVDFQPGDSLPDPATSVPALRVGYDSDVTATALLSDVLQSPVADQLTGLVIGTWSGEMYEATPAEVIEALVASADRLASLRGLFLGDITYEENEISWIYQTDLSALWDAFPRLEVFGVRGSNGLSLGKLRHNHLKHLTVECGGLPKSVLAEIAAASLPALEHLELYLGTENYGWDGTIEDVKPLLAAYRFPSLKYLGLRDAEIADDVAEAVVQSPLLEQIQVLDLSLGMLSDEGAQALIDSSAVRKLKKLDIHYHFVTPDVVKRLNGLGIEVDASDPQDPDQEYRYVSVSE